MEKLLPLQFAGRAERAADRDAFVFACPITGIITFFRIRHDVEDPCENHGDRKTQQNNQRNGFRHPFGCTKSGQEQLRALGDTGADNDIRDGRTNDFSAS